MNRYQTTGVEKNEPCPVIADMGTDAAIYGKDTADSIYILTDQEVTSLIQELEVEIEEAHTEEAETDMSYCWSKPSCSLFGCTDEELYPEVPVCIEFHVPEESCEDPGQVEDITPIYTGKKPFTLRHPPGPITVEEQPGFFKRSKKLLVIIGAVVVAAGAIAVALKSNN